MYKFVDAGDQLRRTGEPDRSRQRHLPRAEAALPPSGDRHRRSRLRGEQEVRRRGLLPRLRRVAGSQFLQQRRGFPSPPRQYPLPRGGREEAAVRPYAQRQRLGNSARDHRHLGELSAGGRQRDRPRRAAPVSRRAGSDREGVTHLTPASVRTSGSPEAALSLGEEVKAVRRRVLKSPLLGRGDLGVRSPPPPDAHAREQHQTHRPAGDDAAQHLRERAAALPRQRPQRDHRVGHEGDEEAHNRHDQIVDNRLKQVLGRGRLLDCRLRRDRRYCLRPGWSATAGSAAWVIRKGWTSAKRSCRDYSPPTPTAPP